MNEFEFEIKPGKRLPPETRIPLPEMSFSQELISQPIPFSHRVEYLSNYVKPTARRLGARQIADILDITEIAVTHVAESVGAERINNSDGVSIYEEYTVEVIEEELEWQKSFDRLPNMVSKFRIADHLGVKWTWVERYAADLSIYPVPAILNGREYLLYPKDVIPKLRTLQLQAPPANNEYTISELQEIIGKDHRWIEKMAVKHDIKLLPRTNLTTNEITFHYPSDFLGLALREKEELPPPAGDWLTLSELAHRLGRGRRWVSSRIIQYQPLAESRLTAQSKPAIHYPPYVLDELRAMGMETIATSEHFSIAQIVEMTGKPLSWVISKTLKYKNVAKLLKSDHQNGALARYYPRYVAEELRTLALEEPSLAGPLLTVEEIVRMVGRRRDWVVKRIGYLGIQSEERLDRRMKPRDHYEPEVVDLLQLNYMVDEENDER